MTDVAGTSGPNITLIRPIEFGEALAVGTRLTAFSEDKPDPLLQRHQVLDRRNVPNRARARSRILRHT
jgi:hypothetical protein